MLCEQCMKNQATYHLTQVVNGEKTETHLCAACMGEQQNVAAYAEASSLLSSFLGVPVRAVNTTPRCSGCGLDYTRFQQTGMLGCAQCYQDFRNLLSPVLQRIHGRVQHEGHVPASAGKTLGLRRRLDQAKGDLQQAIAQEDFEQAAQLRDRVRALQAEMQAMETAEKEGGQHV